MEELGALAARGPASGAPSLAASCNRSMSRCFGPILVRHPYTEQLPCSVLGNARNENRVVSSIPAGSGINTDVSNGASFKDSLAMNECAIAAPIHRIVVPIVLFIAIDEPFPVGRQ